MTLDAAGVFLMRVRDLAIGAGIAWLEGRLGSAAHRDFARRLSGIPPELREPLVAAIVDDLLVALLSALDDDDDIALVAGGTSVADVSDGLAGELFGESGWIARHSRYGSSA